MTDDREALLELRRWIEQYRGMMLTVSHLEGLVSVMARTIIRSDDLQRQVQELLDRLNSLPCQLAPTPGDGIDVWPDEMVRLL